MNADPIERRKLYQDVQDRLMDRIRSGEIGLGEALPSERELMAFYGVGRPAVREALQALERSGIVEISHGERARVAVPTAQRLIQQIAGGTRHLLRTQPHSLEYLKQARMFLETGMARMAAEAATPAAIAILRDLVAAQRAAVADHHAFLAADMAFHRELARISGNPIYPAIIEALFGWAGDYYQSMVRAPGAETLTLAEHLRIVEAVAAHDPDAAAAAMQGHLTRANALYRQLIRK